MAMSPGGGESSELGESASSSSAEAQNSDGGGCGLQQSASASSEASYDNYGRGIAIRTGDMQTIYYASGAIYEGAMKDGKMHGRGVFRYENGDVYAGEWKDGNAHGSGVCRFVSGNVYDGAWRDNKRHGDGTMTWENGDVYEGEFLGGLRHGQGTFTASNGNVYEGKFERGLRHGWGTLKCATEGTYEGEWVGGELHGKVTWKDPVGGIHEQVWASGKQTKTKGRMCSHLLALPRGLPSPIPIAASRDRLPKKSYVECQMRSQRSQERRLEDDKKACEHCGAEDDQYKLRVCTGCNLALYCSAACQKAARRSHQRICDIISHLPLRNADELVLTYDRDKMVDLDAVLRYGTKYMGNLKHLAIKIEEMASGDAIKLSAKQLSSLLKSKRQALESVVFSLSDGHGYEKVCGIIEATVWLELHGLKHLRLRGMRFNGVKLVCDIIHQQKDTLEVLCLPFLGIDWRKAKNRRTIAQGIGSCRHLVHLNLEGCLLMDADLKVMLQDLPNLRILGLTRYGADAHEFTDNTCGIIARKCPGLQELSLLNHNQLSVKGVRKVFEGCTHLRSFYTSTRKLSCKEFQSLLDIAPQLMYLYLGGETRLSNSEISEIIEATGGRVVFQLSEGGVFEPVSVSAKTWESYECQHAALSSIWLRQDDPIANVWAGMLEG